MTSQDVAHAATSHVADTKWDASMERPHSPSGFSTFKDKTMKELSDVEHQIATDGEAKYKRLGWKQLTLMLIVDAIALGALSIPQAFATLGMVAGVICCVGIGLIAIYTSWIIGKVKLAYPAVQHYGDVGTLLLGRFGYELFSSVFVIQLLFVIGSHCLTGTIAFATITKSDVCSLVFGVVTAIILFLLALPSSFADITILGYIDFASIILAIGITIIATGIQSTNSPGGLSSVAWTALPKENITFSEAYVAIGDIVFAYSFATCQFSFMEEMHTPKDFTKSIWALGLIEILIYTITGATIYAFVGPGVQSPALLSAGDTISRIAFGVALPVIFISGSINSIVTGRLLHSRVFKNSVIRYVNTPKGWMTWIAVIAVITILAWVIAEAIPFFSDLLSIVAALFTSGFSFYLPPIMWLVLLRKGSLFSGKNLLIGVVNFLVFLFGLAVLVCGLYSSIDDIKSIPYRERQKSFQLFPDMMYYMDALDLEVAQAVRAVRLIPSN